MEENWNKYRDKIIGLGEHSLRKSYYPELQEKIGSLEASQKNLQTLFNSISDAIIIHDVNGNILYINDHARKTYNINDDPQTKYTVYDISAPCQDTSGLPDVWEKVINNSSQIFEWIGKQLDTNVELSIQVSLSPTFWKGERAIVAVTRDFAARKKYEQELKMAKEKAEEANRLKTEFLNNMSHEIRTPMNGISGFVDLLGEDDISSEMRKYYSSIVQNSCAQLLKIIDDILEISKLETKHIKVYEETFSINDVLMEIFSIFNLRSNKRKLPIYLKKELKQDESYIVSDKTKLYKILNNLLENALKFTYEGYIELGYFTKKNKLVIYVKDTGTGISSLNKEIIFDRFSQGDAKISDKHEGLGLGLSIAKENAQLLDGDINVESVEGEGSTFYVSIPYNPAIKTHTAQADNKKSVDNPSPAKTILIAEDEEINYLYLEAILEKKIDFNYTLIHAKNGKEAVEICNQNSNIDLVLMDIKMPIMNGHEATEKIKTIFPNLPVIAQTAYSTEADKNLALEHRCDDFISKPISKEQLMEIIYKYLPDK